MPTLARPFLGLLILSCFPSACLGSQALRALLVTGGHPHPVSLYSMFTDDSDLSITVNPHPSSYASDLATMYDVIVLYDLYDIDSERDKANVRRFLDSHKGLVVLHHALADNSNWPWWFENVVGGLYVTQKSGKVPLSGYIPNADMNLRVVVRHPITNGIPNFTVQDEAYQNVWVSPKVKVLIETDSTGSMKPLVWISPYKASRVVYIEPGHGPGIFANPLYRRLVHNAIVWAARGML